MECCERVVRECDSKRLQQVVERVLVVLGPVWGREGVWFVEWVGLLVGSEK